jgi:uncharacterized membrane-anchored protein
MRWWSYRIGLLAAFVLQVGLLGWMVGDRALLLMRGKEVRLAVVPIDPRDVFRGDYVTLAYRISRLNPRRLEGDDEFVAGDAIYVALEPRGAEWAAAAIYRKQPSQGTFIAGTVTADLPFSATCTAPCNVYDVDYGLDKFFVPEGTGRELEQLRNTQRVSVDVAVGDNGRAALKRLLVDGRVLYREPTY